MKILANPTFTVAALMLLASSAAIAQEGPAPGVAWSGMPLRTPLRAPLGGEVQPSPGADSQNLLTGLPFAFVENRGQWSGPARFIARKGAVSVHVEPHRLSVEVASASKCIPTTRFTFEGARADVQLEGALPMPGAINYCTGANPEDWVLGLQQFGQVFYRGLYDGVDLRLREHAGRLEFDVLLAPGADLDQVVVQCEGVDGLSIAEDGTLTLETSAGPLQQSAPTTWAEGNDGVRVPLECAYELKGPGRYGFRLLDDSAGLPVVVDPGLEWSTFAGGSAFDIATWTGLDSSGRVLMGGFSAWPGWSPALGGAPDGTHSGGEDCFVACFDQSQAGAGQLVWWTFLGGAKDDSLWDMQVDANDHVHIAGTTNSNDFPTTAGAYDTSLDGSHDGFYADIDPLSGTLVYSTLVGGADFDNVQRLELNGPGRVTLGGATESTDFPTTANAHRSVLQGRDAFLTILEPGAPSPLVYSTLLGGTQDELLLAERTFDFETLPSGEIVVVGRTESQASFPLTPDAQDTIYAGGSEGFLIRIDPAQAGPAGVVYATYLGGSDRDSCTNVGIDPDGKAVVTGYTYSADFETTPDSFSQTYIGPIPANDAFLLRLDDANPDGQHLEYSTFLSGDGYENVLGLTILPDGMIVAVGFSGHATLSANSFPVTCGAYRTDFSGGRDGFALALTPAGNGIDDLHYSTYLGGSGDDGLFGCSVDLASSSLLLHAGGWSSSSDFPTTAGAFQPANAGDWDAVVLSLEMNPRTYCVANANGVSPDGARICGTGSVVVADNALQLSVTDLPLQSFGYFLISNTQATIPLPPPSEGLLCLGSPLARFASFVLNSGASGQVQFTPDLTDIPSPGGPILPGDTHYFQYWYREGASSNTSNGLAVTFH